MTEFKLQLLPSQDGPRIGGLDQLAAAGSKSLPPVDAWDPPYCGDIGLAINRDGSWSYRGSPIRRLAMVKLFAGVLRRDADGKHYLVTPVEKVDVAVADAPFLAVEMEARGHGPEQQLAFRTNVDDIVYCRPENPLRANADADNAGFKPYVRVRGRLEARLTRSVTLDLVAIAVERHGTLGVWSGGAWFELATGEPLMART